MSGISDGLKLVLDLVKKQTPWSEIPPQARKKYHAQLGTEEKWERLRIPWALQLHLPHHETMTLQKNKFYHKALEAFRSKLMPYPYHYQREIMSLLSIPPRKYYIDLISSMLAHERGFNEVPSFTARDVVRLLAIDRNAYIRIANACKQDPTWVSKSAQGSVSPRRIRKAVIKRYMPPPKAGTDETGVAPWWNVYCHPDRKGESLPTKDKNILDLWSKVTSLRKVRAGTIDRQALDYLNKTGYIWYGVPLEGDDRIMVPPLEGFVMNRLNRDQFERLMYDIFVTADETYTLKELSDVLGSDMRLVLDAASLYCRLGFAKRVLPSSSSEDRDMHESWKSKDEKGIEQLDDTEKGDSYLGNGKSVALLYDSSVVSWLMMGSFSVTLKQLSVSMFEIGRLRAKAVRQLAEELGRMDRRQAEIAGGEFLEYFELGVALRRTLLALQQKGTRVAMFRHGSLKGLDEQTRLKLLAKYKCILAIAPSDACLRENLKVTNGPAFLGPPSYLTLSPWMKLMLYDLMGAGPVSILYARGSRINVLPNALQRYRRFLLREWDQKRFVEKKRKSEEGRAEALVVHRAEVLMLLNSKLLINPVLLQGYEPLANLDGHDDDVEEKERKRRHIRKASSINSLKRAEDVHRIKSPSGYSSDLTEVVGFPVSTSTKDTTNVTEEKKSENLKLPLSQEKKAPIGSKSECEEIALSIQKSLGLQNSLGYMRLICDYTLGKRRRWVPLELCFGMPIFDALANCQLCTSVTDGGILKEEALKQHISAMRALVNRLEDFVQKYSGTISSKKGTDSYLPRKTLIFDGTKIRALHPC